MRKLIRPVVSIFAVALVCLAVPSGPLLAQSNYQQQQQWQRQQDMQRQQQDQQRQQMQAQQRQQMQDQQRQQMQAQQRQQMQEQQRQQMQAQQRQQMQQQQQTQQRQQMQTQQQNQQRQTQQQQQTAEQQRRQMQQQGKLGTVQPGTNKPTGMVISGGVAKMNRPLTPGEIQRGFTGRVTTDGRALIKFQGRIFTVPASRVAGLSAKLASETQQQATRWTAQQKIIVNQRLKALTAVNSNIPQRPSGLGGGGGGGGSDCTPPGSAKCQFNQAATQPGPAQVVYSPAVQTRIDSARRAKLENQNAAASGGHGNGLGDGGNGGKNMPPSVGMSGAVANMPHDFKRQAEGKPKSDPTAQRLPYEKGARAREIVLNEERVFVRVHGDKNKASSWIMRHEDIEGLTPQQIKDKFALPELPKYVSDVYVPAGTRLRVGTVNPQDDWGTGRGTQYELKDELPASAFRNQRPLE